MGLRFNTSQQKRSGPAAPQSTIVSLPRRSARDSRLLGPNGRRPKKDGTMRGFDRRHAGADGGKEIVGRVRRSRPDNRSRSGPHRVSARKTPSSYPDLSVARISISVAKDQVGVREASDARHQRR